MKFNNGDIIHGFRVTNLSHIQEVDSDAYLMQHERSGARLLYLANNDDNKVFFISFRTTPDNSKELRISWNTLHSAVPESFLLRNHS